ncbi:MAG: hypothetical protein ACJ79S_11115 [Gemmatimonadaceae bacterium]
MHQRQEYIKPSVLRLEVNVDHDVVAFASCKSALNSDLKANPQTGGPASCATSVCSSGPYDIS